MLEKRLRDITRPKMSMRVKEQQLESIKSSRHTTAQQPQQLMPAIVTFLATVIATVVLIVTLSNSSAPVHDDSIIASDVVLQDIVKATSLDNEKPKKMLDLTSVFYREKLVSTDAKKLKVYEQLLTKATVEPFSWEGIQPNPGTDYLFELADGRSVYLKEFIAIDGGDFYLVNLQSMERYVFEYSDKVAFWDAWDKVFAVEMPPDRWPLFVIFGIIAFVIYRRMETNSVDEDVDNLMPTWLSFWLWYIFGFIMTDNERFFGAQHIGFMFSFSIIFCLFDYAICNLFYNAVPLKKIVLTIVFLIVLIAIIFI